MTKDEVIALMKSSTTVTEWNNNIDTVKAAHDGIMPPYWDEVKGMNICLKQVIPSKV